MSFRFAVSCRCTPSRAKIVARARSVLQRVIGLGGDHVESRDGTQVAVNGKRIDEPYVMRDRFGATGKPYEVTVPEGRLFLLDDNRPNANDSRYFLANSRAA